MIGAVVGHRYRIARKLGSGGTSVVYLATMEPHGGRVAIKFLKDDVAARVGSVERFIIEARASSRVDHPNIVSVFDFGRGADDRYFLVMEYVEGRSLIDLIKSHRGFPQRRAIAILEQLLSAVAAAHGEGIIHRDLKPENVICAPRHGREDFIKILDFGLAKFIDDETGPRLAARPNIVLGTPYYMSPEQARGGRVDSRTDLYSIGVMAYEMLTGRVPFRGKDAVDVLSQHASAVPVPPTSLRPDVEIHPELEHLVLALLAKSPASRYQTAEEALTALARICRQLDEAEARRQAALGETQTIETRVAARDTATTIWEVPGLLEDSSRLARLWDERITTVADLLWGAGDWPAEVTLVTGEIQALEEQIQVEEAAVKPIRQEIDDIDAEAREREAAHRFRRLDLVARRCVVREAQSGGVEISNLERLSDKIDQIEIYEEIRRSADDPRRLEALVAELDRQIDELDAEAHAQWHASRAEIKRRQTSIQERVRAVWQLRSQQVPRCSRLLEIIQEAAADRPELAARVTAVAEVSGAIQIYQSALRAVRDTEP